MAVYLISAPSSLTLAATKPSRPLSILALGQSNIGNNGDQTIPDPPDVFSYSWALNRFLPAHGWLYGGSGFHSNIWAQVATELIKTHVAPFVSIIVFPRGNTRAADWASPNGKVGKDFRHYLSVLVQHHVKVDYITWMQGESDRRTAAADYAFNLMQVYGTIWRSGIHAPMIVAIESRMIDTASKTRDGQLRAIAQNHCLLRGPDLDQIVGPNVRYRVDHFTTAGQGIAAQRWAAVIAKAPRFICPSPNGQATNSGPPFSDD